MNPSSLYILQIGVPERLHLATVSVSKGIFLQLVNCSFKKVDLNEGEGSTTSDKDAELFVLCVGDNKPRCLDPAPQALKKSFKVCSKNKITYLTPVKITAREFEERRKGNMNA